MGRRIADLKKYFLDRVDQSGECWIWLGPHRTKRGAPSYGTVPLRQIKSRYAHRVSYELFRGPITGGLYVCHKCDNPICVRPDHLFLGTQLDNLLDARAKGRLVMNRPNRKLSDADVLRIRELLLSGLPLGLVAQAFDIQKSTASRIGAGKRRAVLAVDFQEAKSA